MPDFLARAEQDPVLPGGQNKISDQLQPKCVRCNYVPSTYFNSNHNSSTLNGAVLYGSAFIYSDITICRAAIELQ